MNTSKILVAEYAIAVAFTSWFAIKNKWWPWPGTIVKISVSFAVFGIVAQAAPEFTAALGAGMLLAAFLKIYSDSKGLSTYIGGVPTASTDFPYGSLNWIKS